MSLFEQYRNAAPKAVLFDVARQELLLRQRVAHGQGQVAEHAQRHRLVERAEQHQHAQGQKAVSRRERPERYALSQRERGEESDEVNQRRRTTISAGDRFDSRSRTSTTASQRSAAAAPRRN